VPPPASRECLGVLGALGNDVDDAYTAFAPRGCHWPAHHFNAIDVFQQRVLNIPKNSGEKRAYKAWRPSISTSSLFAVRY